MWSKLAETRCLRDIKRGYTPKPPSFGGQFFKIWPEHTYTKSPTKCPSPRQWGQWNGVSTNTGCPKENGDPKEILIKLAIFWYIQNHVTGVVCRSCLITCTHFFYKQLGCLGLSLRFWPKIKQLLSNCPASDWEFPYIFYCNCLILVKKGKITL